MNTTPPDTSDNSALRPLANGEHIPPADSAEGGPETLRIRLDCQVSLPAIPAGDRRRIEQRAREIAEQAVSREFRHWETRIQCAAHLPAPRS